MKWGYLIDDQVYISSYREFDFFLRFFLAANQSFAFD